MWPNNYKTDYKFQKMIVLEDIDHIVDSNVCKVTTAESKQSRETS